MQVVCCIFDEKVGGFLPPQVFVTSAVAIRSFAYAANMEEHDFWKFGADYTLFEIGTWDDQKGEMKMYETKIGHGTALQHRSAVSEVPISPTEVMMGKDFPRKEVGNV